MSSALNQILFTSSWQKLLHELVQKGQKQAQSELLKNPGWKFKIINGIKRSEGLAEQSFEKDFEMFQVLQRFNVQAKKDLNFILGQDSTKSEEIMRIKKIVDLKRQISKKGSPAQANAQSIINQKESLMKQNVEHMKTFSEKQEEALAFQAKQNAIEEEERQASNQLSEQAKLDRKNKWKEQIIEAQKIKEQEIEMFKNAVLGGKTINNNEKLS